MVATLVVVWIHSNDVRYFSAPMGISFLADLFMKKLSSWAVPCFFMISGYFFVYSYKSSYKDFLCKKIKSLLVPYCCWCVIAFFLFYPLILIIGFKNSTVTPIVVPPWNNIGFYLDCLGKIFGISRFEPVYNGALWYVKLLFIFFIFAPVFIRINKISRNAIIEFVIIGFLLFVNVMGIAKGYGYIVVQSLSFFILGTSLTKINFFERKIPIAVTCAAGVVYLLISIYESLVFIKIFNHVVMFLPVLKVLCAFMFFCGIFDVYSEQTSHWEKYIPTFFIYCFHMPVTGWLRALGHFLFRDSIYAYFNCFLTFAGTICVCLFSAKILRLICPRIYKVLVAGR